MVNTDTTSQRHDILPQAIDGAANEGDGIQAYYEVLLEEVEKSVEEHNEVGVEALRSNDYESVRRIMEWSEEAKAHHRRIMSLQEEWLQLIATWDYEESAGELNASSENKRLPDGLRTPGTAFRLPILQSLTARGGAATNARILTDVYNKLENVLNDHDHEPLLSNPDQPRWRNTGLWCIDNMVSEGLIMAGSARGMWEITELGEETLSQQKAAGNLNGHKSRGEESTEWDLESDDDVDAFESSFTSEDVEENAEKK